MKNILMIGNSNCYYYVEELCGIAAAEGHEINLCNLFYGSCTLEKHWNFYTNNSDAYDFYHTTKDCRVKTPIKTFIGALEYARSELGKDWDAISLQQSGYYSLVGTAESAMSYTMSYAKDFYSIIRKSSPNATLYWHQPWAYEVGYGANKTDQREHVDSIEKQNAQHYARRMLADAVSKAEEVDIIPTGEAWQIAHANDLIGQTLCARKGVNNDLGDYDHDGDIGGGRYLTACVWFEGLMKKSCIGNTWRPHNYELAEEKIEILQKAAHEAVATAYGSDFAK